MKANNMSVKKNIGKFPEYFYDCADYSGIGNVRESYFGEFHNQMLDEIRQVMKKYGCIEITVDHGDLEFNYESYSQDEEKFAWFFKYESQILAGE